MIGETEKKILQKMLFEHYIGGRHTSEDNVAKGFARDSRGEVKKALKNLIRAGYVIPKITSYGLEVSLNPRRMVEISQLAKG
jgi:predicted transcriptional regulator